MPSAGWSPASFSKKFVVTRRRGIEKKTAVPPRGAGHRWLALSSIAVEAAPFWLIQKPPTPIASCPGVHIRKKPQRKTQSWRARPSCLWPPGVKLDRAERRKVMALAQAWQIDAVLVTELSRWGRSTTDLLATLKELEARRVSVITLNGMAFDLATPHWRIIATVLAGIAESERELIQERIRSGIKRNRPASAPIN